MTVPGLSRREFMKRAAGAGAGLAFLEADIPMFAQSDSGLTSMTLSEVSRLMRERKVSPVEVTQACLRRIEQLNPKLNAFITVTTESALAEAKAAEAAITGGRWQGPLHGVPVAVKDLLDTAGVRTTAGSGILKDRVPTQDAKVVQLLRAAGAVPLGKLNLHEFAYGGSSAISYFGPVRNPWNTAYSPGGSSGGSAAAVAAGLCFGAIGTDTGGSIREPAAYCGIAGLKPTYGRVSCAGVLPLCWSLDHVGPMTRSVLDAALLLNAIAGYDPADPASQELPVEDFAAATTRVRRGVRMGLPVTYFTESLHPEIAAAFQEALAVLETLGLSRHPMALPPPGETDASLGKVYRVVFGAETVAYHQDHLAARADQYQPLTLRRLGEGAGVTATEYAQGLRRLQQLRRECRVLFEQVDVIVTPTTPLPPFTVAELTDDKEARPREVQMLRNTRPFNLLGLPTISVPCGFTEAGLPIGLQMTGPSGGEGLVLAVAHQYEQATSWHKRPVRVG